MEIRGFAAPMAAFIAASDNSNVSEVNMAVSAASAATDSITAEFLGGNDVSTYFVDWMWQKYDLSGSHHYCCASNGLSVINCGSIPDWLVPLSSGP